MKKTAAEGCNLMCSGSETIIDLTNCIEETDEYYGSENPFDQNSVDGDFGGSSGGSSQDININPTLTSPIHSDGTSATADFLINIIGNLSQSQIDWIKNSDNKTQVDQLLLFLSQNGSSPEAISFAVETMVAMMNGEKVDFNQFSITQYINNLNNPTTGSPIEFYLIAQYKSSILLDLSLYSISSNEIQVGEYILKPHYGLGNKLIFYTAYRVNNIGVSTLGVEYIVRADALQEFQNKINFYTYAANLFYAGGIPSQGQIAMAAGDTWKGFGSMWNNALHSEEWWAYVILSFGHAIVNLPVNSTISSTQTSPNWKVSLNKMTSEAFQGKVVTNPQGANVTIDIPKNYVPSIAENGQGINFSPNPPVGTHIDAGVIRVKQPTQSGVTYPHPKGYVKFHNNIGQPINPINGQPLGNDFNHFDFK